MEQLNHTLFLLINAGPEPPFLLLHGAVFFARWLIYCLPVLLLTLWLWGSFQSRQVAVKALLAVLAGIVIVYVIRMFWYHPRPFVIGLGYAYLEHAPNASFPSNHAMFSFSMALSFLWNGMRTIGWVVFSIALLISWARIYLGIHFPLDMIGALVAAFVIVTGINHLFRLRQGGDQLVVMLETVYRRALAIPIAKGWFVK